MFKPIPSHIYVKGIRVSIKYEGQTRGKICYNCGLHGHLGRECTKPDKRYSLTANSYAPNPDNLMEFPALHPQSSPNSGITFTNSTSESTDDKDSINEPSYEHQGDNPREENNPGANTTIPTKNKTTKN
ncbi:hypothetical protein SNE40_004752 [Patella caerulea]|uniref:CCHC-type domain-containing protein n=1 Tax=Patella caerulea TaxID=87958 RepID=A0AAN8KAA0_PATCE